MCEGRGGRVIGDNAQHVLPPGRADAADGKIVSIQLLRALAAAIVAVLHLAFAFADHVGSGLGLERRSGPAGQLAVLLFFIVSGYVMVVASRSHFGQPGARRTFWLRRIFRIMPPYWLASLLLALIFLTIQPQPVPLVPFLKSLVLLPFWPDDGGLRPMPFLWVGWTLFYEMLFYLLFGLFIGLGRSKGVAVTGAILLVLVLAGLAIGPVNPMLFALTRPVLLMFLVGMGLAVWRESGGWVPGWIRALALFAMIPAVWLIDRPVDPEAMGFDYLAWCGLPALLLGFAVLSGPLRLPAARMVVAAGDMSYALYLLHLPIAWFWLWLYNRLPFFAPGAWDYLVTVLIVTFAASWLFFVKVERPMTAALNRLARSPHQGKLVA